MRGKTLLGKKEIFPMKISEDVAAANGGPARRELKWVPGLPLKSEKLMEYDKEEGFLSKEPLS